MINLITGKLSDSFPEMKADFTSNQAFALSDDSVEYMSHLSKNVTLHINAEESVFRGGGRYFIQAQSLLDKMVSKSGGKFTYDFVDITGSMRNLKEFLKHRDADDAFADARKNGYVGIPALLRDDGSLSTDWEAYLKEKGVSAEAAALSGQSCRIDGSGC